MSVSAHFEQPIHPDRIAVSLTGYLAAAILCADIKAQASKRLATHQPRLHAA
ncbi:hypothetical protein [Methylobacterium nodulans]|uniref:Uncharacterized protein n=1 Tax=Methylobacterium nodulans (strain LMG 21967 / CNCM I-2342 / ORS 2060) TaxID=460265 RepID=B8IRZ9_METNO|nr:hypothetical protein [Methylobacterium nodulans]ACL56811.1 hypothetical protein Mnod_1821 [Methylobacterium nodulans ORS 2060]